MDAGKPCQHDNTEPGPRCPLRWGSAPTEVCKDCGMYRLLDRWLSDWRIGPVPTSDEDE